MPTTPAALTISALAPTIMTTRTITGNTVKIICAFVDWDGEPADPDAGTATVTIYDSTGEIVEEIEIGEEHRIETEEGGVYETGKYAVLWTAPDDAGDYYAEFCGELDGAPAVARELVQIGWV